MWTKIPLPTDRESEITDSRLHVRLTKQGREYVETHHEASQVALNILQWLDSKGIKSMTLFPNSIRNCTCQIISLQMMSVVSLATGT